MQKRILPALFAAAVTVVIVISACTKIDTTTIGSDALTVDNINTFADTLAPDIIATEFSLPDSTIISKEDNYIIGKIDNDPLFGKTDAAINVFFKPSQYPYYFGNAGDIVRGIAGTGLDSVVVTFSYKSAYGDTSAASNIPQQFEVFQITEPAFYDKTDTVRKLDYQPAANTGSSWGTAMITPQIISKKIVFPDNSDSADTQIRIKLNATGFGFFKNLYDNQDSTSTCSNNAFYNDDKYRAYSVPLGLSIRSTGGGKITSNAWSSVK